MQRCEEVLLDVSSGVYIQQAQIIFYNLSAKLGTMFPFVSDSSAVYVGSEVRVFLGSSQVAEGFL